MVKIAKIGDVIEFKRNDNEMFGTVYSVLDNSVVVDCTAMCNLKELRMPERTVVNHRNYQIVGGSEKIEDYAETYKSLRSKGWSDARIRTLFGWGEVQLRELKTSLGMLGERVPLKPEQRIKVRRYRKVHNPAAYEH